MAMSAPMNEVIIELDTLWYMRAVKEGHASHRKSRLSAAMAANRLVCRRLQVIAYDDLFFNSV